MALAAKQSTIPGDRWHGRASKQPQMHREEIIPGKHSAHWAGGDAGAGGALAGQDERQQVGQAQSWSASRYPRG